MAKRKDPVGEEVVLVFQFRQQEALSALLHWLKRVSREVVVRGNVFHGPLFMHIEFKNRRYAAEFFIMTETMSSIVLKKKSLMQADIMIDSKKLAEETA